MIILSLKARAKARKKQLSGLLFSTVEEAPFSHAGKLERADARPQQEPEFSEVIHAVSAFKYAVFIILHLFQHVAVTHRGADQINAVIAAELMETEIRHNRCNNANGT